MRLEIADDSLAAAVRRIVREELAVFFEQRVAELRGEPRPGAGGSMPEAEPTPEALEGISPYDRVRFAEYVLKEAGGGPLHVRAIAERMYRLGYKHRSQPKNPEQILSSLNSLASPSQHPERFKRGGSRSLELVR
jgi:HB1, ASXL, restriction endonuclease HTH domain